MLKREIKLNVKDIIHSKNADTKEKGLLLIDYLNFRYTGKEIVIINFNDIDFISIDFLNTIMSVKVYKKVQEFYVCNLKDSAQDLFKESIRNLIVSPERDAISK